MPAKYTIRQGLDVAREYASAAKLRALPAGTYICIGVQYETYVEWRAERKHPHKGDLNGRWTCTPATLRDLRSPRLLAFTIAIPEADNG